MSEAGAPAGLIRAMTIDDLATVLAWRNHIAVRRHMFQRHEIGVDEHRQWFERSTADSGCRLMIFEEGGRPMGFTALTMDEGSGVGDWGFYVASTAPRGSGRAMGRRVLAQAFGLLGLHKVCGRVIGSNDRSIAMHLALGFKQEGVLRDQYFDGAAHHDVHCFGLLAAEWAAAQNV